MTTLQDLKALDLAGAQVTLWTIKGPTGPAANAPKFSGRWVETSDEVDDALKATLVSEVAKIEEVLEYSLLAQNNEASALQIPADETHADQLLQEIAAELPGKKATETKHLQNSAFYAAKFVIGEQVVWALRKTEPSWKTKKATSVRNLFFSDQQLAIDDRPHFELGKTFDFIIFSDNILVRNKGRLNRSFATRALSGTISQTFRLRAISWRFLSALLPLLSTLETTRFSCGALARSKIKDITATRPSCKGCETIKPSTASILSLTEAVRS